VLILQTVVIVPLLQSPGRCPVCCTGTVGGCLLWLRLSHSALRPALEPGISKRFFNERTLSTHVCMRLFTIHIRRSINTGFTWETRRFSGSAKFLTFLQCQRSASDIADQRPVSNLTLLYSTLFDSLDTSRFISNLFDFVRPNPGCSCSFLVISDRTHSTRMLIAQPSSGVQRCLPGLHHHRWQHALPVFVLVKQDVTVTVVRVARWALISAKLRAKPYIVWSLSHDHKI